MSSILNPPRPQPPMVIHQPAPTPPPAPTPTPPPAMPTPDPVAPAALEARRRRLATIAQRSGRSSTMLTTAASRAVGRTRTVASGTLAGDEGSSALG